MTIPFSQNESWHTDRRLPTSSNRATLCGVDGKFLVALAIACVACGERMTVRDPHEANGNVFYTEHTAPSFGDSLGAAARGCTGGARADDQASSRVPTREDCARQDFKVSYVVDGVYQIEACGEMYKVRCMKTTTVSDRTAPADCGVICYVDDHYRLTQ